VTPAGSGFASGHTPAAIHELTPAPNANPYGDSNPPDPEAQRIQDELSRLRDDAGARQAFYDELRRTVEQVRSGLRDEDSKNPPSSGPAWHRFHDASGEAPNPPAKEGPNESPPANVEGPQASLGRHRGSLDGAAYQRVVRYAKANGTPVPLALGVAWIESRLQTYPPRGAAGEVGMFQILPARCRIEGWPPKRLKEPEFNAWLGTRLLAQYYQEEGSWARAAAKYVAGPGVFDRNYSHDLWAYIDWYASSVDSYAGYFSRYQS
jgi:soluble lytic murein transglycosylase-like protein